MGTIKSTEQRSETIEYAWINQLRKGTIYKVYNRGLQNHLWHAVAWRESEEGLVNHTFSITRMRRYQIKAVESSPEQIKEGDGSFHSRFVEPLTNGRWWCKKWV